MESMESKVHVWWQKKRKPLILAGYIIASGLIIAFVVAIIGGYLWNWDWTGINTYLGPATKPNQQYRPAKTLWDWLQLLIVPAVLWILGMGFTRGQRRRDQQLAEQQKQVEREITEYNQ